VNILPTLRSGLIPAALFADKLRRVLFGQLRDYVKKDKEFANRIAYYSALLNRALFTLLVDELKVDKLDVVRITIDYDVDEEHKEVKWKWDTLKVEVFKRVSPESYAETLKTFIAKAPEIARVMDGGVLNLERPRTMSDIGVVSGSILKDVRTIKTFNSTCVIYNIASSVIGTNFVGGYR